MHGTGRSSTAWGTGYNGVVAAVRRGACDDGLAMWTQDVNERGRK